MVDGDVGRVERRHLDRHGLTLEASSSSVDRFERPRPRDDLGVLGRRQRSRRCRRTARGAPRFRVVGRGVEQRGALTAHDRARRRSRPRRAPARRTSRSGPLGDGPAGRRRPVPRSPLLTEHPPADIMPERDDPPIQDVDDPVGAAATSGSWVTITMVWPRSCRARSRSSTSAADSLSSAPVGSSASSRSGWLATARAIATRCCSPPDSVPGRFRSRPVRPSASRSSSAVERASRARRTGQPLWELDVGADVEVRDQVVLLEDVADPSPAQPCAIGTPSAVTSSSPRSDRTGVGQVETAEQMQHRRLPASARSHRGHPFPSVDLERQPP